MRVLTIGEVLNMGPGEIVPAIKGQVKEVKKVNTGQNQYGPWTCQNITLMDNTGLVQVKFWNHPEITAQWVGHWMYIEAVQGKKGGLEGLTVIDNEYRGRVTRQIEAKAEVPITQAQPGAATPPPVQAPLAQATAPLPPPAPLPSPMQAPLPTSPMAPPPTHPQSPVSGYKAVREHLGRSATGLILCFDAAYFTAQEVHKRHPELQLTVEDIRSMAVHFSITLERTFKIDGLPIRLPEDKPVTQSPAQPPSAVTEPEDDLPFS